MRRILFDTESDGLAADATKIHCIAAVDVDTGERRNWKPDQIEDGLRVLSNAHELIGHNIKRHDIPLMSRLYGFQHQALKIRDTMICARTIYPNVKDTDRSLVLTGRMPPGRDYQGKHTIAAWGYRLGRHKGDYAKNKAAEWQDKYPNLYATLTEEERNKRILEYVWGTWNEEMHEYMLQDVETNLALWQHLKVDDYSQPAIELEHRIAFVCSEMEKAGVPFDIDAATKLHVELIGKRDVVEKQLMATFGSWEAPISPDPNKCIFIPKRDNAKLGYKKGVPVHKTKIVTFNPGSRDHIAKVLKDRGWVPEKMTEGGKPQIDEDTVASIVVRYPELAGLGEYLMIEKRLSQLADGKQAWLKVVKDDRRIHGAINPMGTGTSRASHFNPNMAQVPKVTSPYGTECRSLVYAPPGWKIVGADMAGLELRGLAHYLQPMDNGKYASVVLDGDPHWMHTQAMTLAEGERDKHSKLHNTARDGSKTFVYAYIYGCGDGKAGEIVFSCVDAMRKEGDQATYDRFFPNGPNDGALKRVGKKVRDSFANRIAGFSGLKDKIAEQTKRFGWVPGLDGRRIPVKSEHSALNYLIQSAGAILCKRWVCDAFDAMSERFNYDYDNPWNGDFVFGLWVHDEIQVWVKEGLEAEASNIIVNCASKAGEPYGFRLRLDGDASWGRTWAETH